MEKAYLENMIDKYDAERVFARTQSENAMDEDDIVAADVWETIEVAYTDLIYKLQPFLNQTSTQK